MTAQVKKDTINTVELSAESVALWLEQQPDFFTTRPGLLSSLELSHKQLGASSLIEKQVHVLRNQKTTLENKLFDLIEIAKDNELLSQQVHNMALVLLSADGLDSVINSARNELIYALEPDELAVKVFTRSTIDTANYFVNPREISRLFSSAFRTKRCLCGDLNKVQNRFLFKDNAAEIKSSIFIPLFEQHPIGYIAMGSRDVKRFSTSMGTHFLDRLGETVSCTIHNHQ